MGALEHSGLGVTPGGNSSECKDDRWLLRQTQGVQLLSPSRMNVPE